MSRVLAAWLTGVLVAAGTLVRCPTLVIAGARDIGATPAMGEAIAAAIPGAQYSLLDDASHLSVREQPVLFAARVQAFIAGLPA